MKLSPRSRHVLAASAELVVLACLTFIPMLLTKPGMVSSDTKLYLYTDPGRFMAQVVSMWAPWFAAGTVTHQYIGYLLPQGPFFAALSILHVPMWVAQRLWFGSLLFLAGAGVRYALRVMGMRGPGPLLAAIVYALNPYSMQYIERISAILMPWAGLGWLLGFTVMAVRRGGWRYPALFALVVALAGGINATSLIYVGVAPVGWVIYTLAVTKEQASGQTILAALKIGLLSFGVSVWWVAGLYIEGIYGINILKYTETVPAIAGPATASEVMRGLGYWYFYGTDRLGPWLSSSVVYTQDIGLLAVSFVLPVLGFLGAVFTRWKARAYFALLALVGLVLSVGTHPYTSPTSFGGVLKAFMTETTAGFALRSTDRATPLVTLALAAFLGSLSSAAWEKVRYISWPPALLPIALAIVNAGPMMTGQAVDAHFDRPSNIPSYFNSAAKYLDAEGDNTRVWVEPGIDFSDYTWGNTIDPVWPAVLTRPELDRAQLIDGSFQTADLLDAFDLTVQQGTYEPSTLVPIARLLDAGDFVLESDYKYWHYNTPLPQATWLEFEQPPAGMGKPIAFGKPVANEAPAQYALVDEQALATPVNSPSPAPVEVFPVSNARPIYRAEPAGDSVVLDGSGDGIVSAAATGLLNNNPTIIYAGTLDGSKKLLSEAVQSGATLVLTDTNRKEVDRWSSVRDNEGETLPAVSEPSSPDPTAQPLPIFTTSSVDSQSVATYSEAHYVTASSYGNPVAFTPEDRPYMAVDDSLDTGWTVSAFSPALGQWLQVALDKAVTTDHISLVQPAYLQPNRWISKVTLSFDGGHKVTETLNQASHTDGGQLLTFPTTTFSTLRITIDSTTWTDGKQLTAASGVGFANVGIPGVNIFETIQMPSDMLNALGTSSQSHRLVVILTRQRVSPYPPRSDPEPSMSRSFFLPTPRSFTLGGNATLSALVDDNDIDAILSGGDSAGEPTFWKGNILGSNERLPGDLNARGLYAWDGNSKTWWSPGYDAQAQIGAWTQANLVHPRTFDHIDLQVVADGEHSVPTRIQLTASGTSTGTQTRTLTVPPITDSKQPGHVATVRLNFPSVTGSVLRVTVQAVRQVTTTDWYTAEPIVMPVAIANVGVPGLAFKPENPAASIPAICRSGLMTINNKPVSIEITGKVGVASTGGDLSIAGCGPDAKGITLGPGTQQVQTVPGSDSGFNLNRVTLDSAASGTAEAPLSNGDLPPAPGTLAGSGVPAVADPNVKVLATTNTSARLEVTGADSPFWLVLGQSLNAGWQATVVGGSNLGAPTLIDGFSNGWYVTPGAKSTFYVDMSWTPQKGVDDAIVVSIVAIGGSLILALMPVGYLRRRRRRGNRQESRSRRGASRKKPRKGAHTRQGAKAVNQAVALSVDDPGTDQTATEAQPGRVDDGAPVPDDIVGVDELGDGAWAPALALPWSRTARPASLVASVVLAVVVGLITFVNVPAPAAAPAALGLAVVTLLAARLRIFRSLFALTAVAGSAAAGIITVTGQMQNHFAPGDGWPTNFEAASVVTLVAFCALAADCLVETIRLRRPHEPDDPPGNPGNPGEARSNGDDHQVGGDPLVALT